MRNLRHAAVVAAIIGIGLAGSAGADVVDLTPGSDTVAQWDFSNNLDATHTASGVTATAVGFTFSEDQGGRSSGDGINADGSSYTGGEPIEDDDWSGDDGRIYGRVFDNIDSTAYEFSISVDAGESIVLDHLATDIGWRGGGPDHVRFAYSTDGFSTETIFGEGQGFNENAGEGGIGFADDGGLNVIKPGRTNFSWNRYVVDLGGLVVTDTMDFRIYFGGATATDSEANIYLDNLTVAVPEPATMAMLGLGGLAALLRRRKA